MSVASALAGLSVALGALGLAELARSARRGPRGEPRRNGSGDGGEPPGRTARLLRVLAAAGHGLRRRLGARTPTGLAGRIAAAGTPAGLGIRELMAAKLAAALIAGALALPAAAAAPGRLGVAVAIGLPVAGFFTPDRWLARLAAERARRVRRDLPALLDLLRVSVEAGLTPVAALAAVGRRSTGPLAAEWRAVCGEVALGVPLAEALERSERRLPLPEVRALGAALRRAQRHGAPLGETIAAQAREARLARRRQIEEEAAKAGPKIQLVVALLLVPSVLLLVAAALAAAMLDGGGLPGLP